MGSSFFLSELSSWPYHSHYHYPLKLLQIVVLSSHQHQGTEPPSLAQQSGLSTQSCQKTSTNDTKVRRKLCDLSLYLWTHTKKTLRMQFFITGLVRERGDSSCVHKHWAAQSKGSVFCIFVYQLQFWYILLIKVAVSDVCGDFTYEDVYLRSWDLAKGILGILGQVRDKVHHHNKKEPQ